MKQFDQILNFYELLTKFRAVERKILIKGDTRRENDSEHSFSLAMLAWYINQTYKLGLDQEKIFMYALTHDLVEVYAGDTYFYLDTKSEDEKKKREQSALERIKKETPEFVELYQSIESYERRDDEESKFIYALDKAEPIINIYLDGGRTWKELDVTLEMLTTMKNPKVAVNPTVEKIFKELVERLNINRNTFFKK